MSTAVRSLIPALPNDLIHPNFDENALRVLRERYFARKADGTIEGPQEFLWRVAYAVARADARYGPEEPDETEEDEHVLKTALAFYAMMARLDFLPNTPCLINAGRPLSMLSACFVLPVPDSMDGIFESIKSMAMIQKSGGGTGYAFSQLRGSGSLVQSTGKDSSGPIAFMKVFNAATDSIKQGGVRRGANMAVLRVDHPDVLAFIRCKKELDTENRALYNRLSDTGRYTEAQLAHIKQELLQTQFNNFNISIGITDAFMAAVDANADFELRDPRTKSVVRTLPAREIFDALVEGAWQNGEPGVLFLDHPQWNPLPGLGPIEATNPCGEQALHGMDSCNLGSINIGHFVEGTQIDWDRLRMTVRSAIHFLDNVIDENLYPIPEIKEMVTNNRRVGLGIMGFADALISLGIGYGSDIAIDFVKRLMSFIQEEAIAASETIARERGDFPNKHLSIWKDDPRPRRNAALLSIAPTGTISMIAGCSFGCEPHFGLAYTKHVMKDAEGRAQALYQIVPAFADAYKRQYGKEVSTDVLAAIAENRGSLKGVGTSFVTPEMEATFTVTADVSVEQHIDMLAAFQMHTCNAVSKTINAPNDDTRENVAKAIVRAYESGCKGFTYYRDGSRTEQVVTFTSDVSPVAKAEQPLSVPVPAAQQSADSSVATILARAKAAISTL